MPQMVGLLDFLTDQMVSERTLKFNSKQLTHEKARFFEFASGLVADSIEHAFVPPEKVEYSHLGMPALIRTPSGFRRSMRSAQRTVISCLSSHKRERASFTRTKKQAWHEETTKLETPQRRQPTTSRSDGMEPPKLVRR